MFKHKINHESTKIKEKNPSEFIYNLEVWSSFIIRILNPQAVYVTI